jgi:hypothetical protein
MGRKFPASRIRFGLCTPGSPVLMRKPPKVSGPVREYSRFAAETGLISTAARRAQWFSGTDKLSSRI